MKHDCCENCYYWDYIDDTSESNAKMCYYIAENSEHPAACLSAEMEVDYVRN